ncbi:MAG TPA: hypothetical protein VN203_23255 [Candidatus Acidoferrum sp.]|nr:hypothetical protein [Candidatus Acidoferrum sp.]
MDRVTIKTSTIFISVGPKMSIYRSVDDVPPRLRRKLHESTTGINAATILIADRKGREEIVKALQGLPSGLRPRTSRMGRKSARKMDWKTWAEILLPGLVGLLIWLAFNYR